MLNLFRSTTQRFYGSTRAGAAVEFALSGLALFAFLLAILNLGLLGFSLAALARGVQAAARTAAVTAAASYTTSTTNTITCPSITAIAGYFNTYADPPLPPAGTTSGSNPSISGPAKGSLWTNSAGSSSSLGLYVTLTGTYKWVPLGLAAFGKGITLRITSVATVTGTEAIKTSC
jgi:Flp pilus assembly protein TadG